MVNTQKLTHYVVFSLLAGALLGIVGNLLIDYQQYSWLANLSSQLEAYGVSLPATAEFTRSYFVDGVFRIGGELFISLLKLMVIPVVFISLICGTYQLRDNQHVGRIASKTLGLYVLTTAFAIVVGILFALSFNIGQVLEGDSVFKVADFTPPEKISLSASLASLIPTNLFHALSQNNQLLQIILFAALFGITLSFAGDAGERIAQFFQDLNEVVIRLVIIILYVAPIGVFCLVAQKVSLMGLWLIGQLVGYFLVLVAALLFQGLVIYSLLLRFLGGLSPIIFFRKMYPAMIFAFSTASSNATIPVTLDTVENKLGVKNSLAAFTVPLGATINMDGTAIMQGVATIFIANIYNIDLGLAGYLTIVLMATLASIGTAGVPGIGMITLAMVFAQLNIPPEGIAIILGIDRLLDMLRTVVNISGDAAISCIVAKSEGILNHAVFTYKKVTE
jgi:Na+/H+-dicarboxylate symporter